MMIAGMNLIVDVHKGTEILLEMTGLTEQIVRGVLGGLGICQSWLPHVITSLLLTRACDAVGYEPSLKPGEYVNNDSLADTRWSG